LLIFLDEEVSSKIEFRINGFDLNSTIMVLTECLIAENCNWRESKLHILLWISF